mmetsp:Transcript_42165/g.164827  ORF Transcript_42165/g.164827 Transcript_42165/m.164827 type:complete len:125 (-) Transcript_42165:1245-1619(-)
MSDELTIVIQKRDAAQVQLSKLKEEVKQLEDEVTELEKQIWEGRSNVDDVRNKCRQLNERVTQSTLKVDGVEVSRDLATTAIKNDNRPLAKDLARLLIRRKGCVKSLLDVGARIEDIEKDYKRK